MVQDPESRIRDLEAQLTTLQLRYASAANPVPGGDAHVPPPIPDGHAAPAPDAFALGGPSSFDLGIGNPGSQRKRDPAMPNVETYDGKSPAKAREFLLHLAIFFMAQPTNYGREESKLAYACSRLRGTAFLWITPMIVPEFSSSNVARPKFATFAEFKTDFMLVFGEQDRVSKAETAIRNLKQGNRSAASVASELRAYSVDVAWDEAALRSAF